MSRKEVPRAGLVKAALAGKITNAEGARALRISVRQFRRLKQRVKAEGARGLFDSARADDFPEVAKEADSLRQRLQAVKRKLEGDA